MAATRNALIDWLRALAILMVITVHTWSLAHIDDAAHPMLAMIYKAFYQCGVPLFVLLSGALQLSAPVQPFGSFYKKRYARILIPFLIWSIAVYVLSIIAGKYGATHTPGEWALNYIPYMLTNRINEAYWFIGLIVALYAITPFLQRALQGCSRKELLILCVCWLCYAVLRRVYPALYLLEYTSRLTYFLGFYIIGYVLYREWGTLISAKENTIIRAISDCSYMTYLMHMIFISPLYMLIGFSGLTAPLWACCLVPITTSIAVLALCTTGGVIAKKILPFYRYLGIN